MTTRPDDAIDDPVVEVRTLSAAYGTVGVLDRVSIDLTRGEVLGVVGENGAGKTTFADLLLGLVTESARVSGSVTYHPEGRDPVDILELDGSDLQAFRRETVSVVTHGRGLNPTMTVREQFRDTVGRHADDEGALLAEAGDLLASFGLDADRVLDTPPGDLSDGVAETALLVHAIVGDPEVLVVDGRSTALSRLAARPALLDERGLTVVALSRELPTLAALADRLAVLADGHFVEVGSTDDVLGDPTHPHTRELVAYYDDLGESIGR